MNPNRLVAPIALLAVVTIWPAVVTAQTQGADYPKMVSPGAVTLEFEPDWQDTALVIVVRAKAKEGDLGRMGINLQDQVMLVCERQTHAPFSSGGALAGRQGLAWIAFRLPRKPTTFALSIRDVPDVPMRIVRWPEVALTPEP
jgi:hypothetical protein